MSKIGESKHKFKYKAENYVVERIIGELERAIELKEQGEEAEGDKVVNDVKAWLEESIQQIEDKKQQKEVTTETFILPGDGEKIAWGEKLWLSVINDDEREKYLAVSYEYSYMKGAFKEQAFQDNLWDEIKDENSFVCSIYDKESRKYIGYCSVKDMNKKDWEMAIEIIPEYCHKGYGTEALPLLMKNLHKLTGKRFFCARVEIDNYPSQGLMKKIGGIPDGICEFLLHGEEIEKFQKEHKDEITDEIRAVAEEFCMDAEDILGYVLCYRFDMEVVGNY